MAKGQKHNTPVIQNRKARHDYHIDTSYEAGIALVGTEVKSLRKGNANFTDAYAQIKNGEIWLQQLYITPYDHQSLEMNHDPRRPRKLLLSKREIKEMDRQVNQKGVTLIPLKLYFKGHLVKVEIGLARGKKKFDKRESIKEADTKRDMDRKLKGSFKIKM